MGKKIPINYGNCRHCGGMVAMTIHNKAVRHGFVRVKRGYRRVAFPSIKGGHDAHACAGSGKYCIGYDKDSAPNK